ncbi:MAG: lipase [Chloroflexi bacterium OHK40]
MRPLVIIGGYLTGPGDFAALAEALARPPYGYQVFVAPISRARWALTRDWDFRPVLAIVRQTVAHALATTGADRLTVLGHSVGGTVARMYLGEAPYLGEIYGGRRYVQRLVMLGTPHHSLERWTRRSIGFVNTTYPGACYPDVTYVSVIGRAIRGNPRGGLLARMAASSYATVSGPEHARAWGDGITTLHCAALTGAEYLVVNGLTHSPLHGRPWYGDPEALPLWGRVLAPTRAYSPAPVV